MGLFGPYNLLSVAPAAEHEALSGRRRTIVGGHQLPVFHLIAQAVNQLLPLGIICPDVQIVAGFLQCRVIFRYAGGQHTDKCHECFAGMLRVGDPYLFLAPLYVDQRAPGLNFLHILHHQHPGPHIQRPFQHHPA